LCIGEMQKIWWLGCCILLLAIQFQTVFSSLLSVRRMEKGICPKKAKSDKAQIFSLKMKCHGEDIKKCRKALPKQELKKKKKKKKGKDKDNPTEHPEEGKKEEPQFVYVAPCQPKGHTPHLDKLCDDLSNEHCPGSYKGGFGLFLRSVTEDCKSKSFEGYFGLDGMTYGILDFTEDNLPGIFELAQRDPQTKAEFEKMFAKTDVLKEMKGGCLDKEWACDQNNKGYFNCDPEYRAAMENFVTHPLMQQLQLQIAYDAYLSRIERYYCLGMKTIFGNVMLATVANNLRDNAACKPTNWLKDCNAKHAHEADFDEAKLINCMLLEHYVVGPLDKDGKPKGCRKTPDGARRRANEIIHAFKGRESELFVWADQPKVEDLVKCSTNWGNGGTAEPEPAPAPLVASSDNANLVHESGET